MTNKERQELNSNFYTNMVFITKQDYKVTIVEYVDKNNVYIKFENSFIMKVRLSNLKRGSVKNPYHKEIFGVGYFGYGDHISSDKGNTNKQYRTWYNLLLRCYSEKTQEKQPTYKGCSVVEEWHNFQNFAQWFENNYIDGWQLDKDILIKGNKVYSPEACCFVPQEINTLFIKNNINRGSCPIGVVKEGNKYKAYLKIGNGIQKYLGLYKTIEEAFQAYKEAKEIYIKEIANKWKSLILDEVYQAMCAYQVEITD
jgi:hypothetical protein